jgi:membrane protease YdiL (CAAX protease family)
LYHKYSKQHRTSPNLRIVQITRESPLAGDDITLLSAIMSAQASAAARQRRSIMVRTRSNLFTRNPLLTYFGLAYAISWAFWLPLAASEQGLLSVKLSGAVFSRLAALGPVAAALLVSHIEGGRRAVHGLLRGLLGWRVGIHWYLAAALAYPALIGVALGIDLLLGGGALTHPVNDLKHLHMPFWFLLAINPPFLLCEEIGWRGFALPRLQRKYSAWLATLILGVLWVLWHIPSYLMLGSIHTGVSFPFWAFAILLMSFVFTWLYNGTKGSVLHPWLFHLSMNWSGFLIPYTDRARGFVSVLVIVAIALIVILARPGRLGPEKHTGTEAQ